MRAIADSKQKAFTLIELMIVIVIVGVLATVAIVHLSAPKEEAFEKEAKSNLQMIAAAERMYRLESGFYVPAVNEIEINQNLRLVLPSSGSRNWAYAVTTSGGNTLFNASATRMSGPKTGTKYYVNQTALE